MDLSGTMQGAGGVGGLLAVTDSTGTYYPTYDGNGNVSEYLDSTGAVVAHYEYDPFGKITVATGPKANDFAHRFSTKPLDATTGLYYYAYRYYDPVTGRWPSRDPIEEEGGLNLYGFVRNNGVSYLDILGLTVFTAITFIPVDYLQDPTGTWFKGDGQPDNTSKGRKDYRTLQIVTVKLDDVACNEDFNSALNEILNQERDTGKTIRYKSIGEPYVFDSELPFVSIPASGFYQVDEETKLAKEKATWIESNPGDIILRKKENGKCEVCGLRFTMVADAANPLGKPGSPHINYKYAFDYTKENGWKVSGAHDGYPSYTLHMDDKLIHHYSAVGHNPIELAGDSDVTFGWRNIH
jgi:RHS repeat-associated protein